MSKKINVNPGQYKVAGRERQGEDVVHDRQKQRLRNVQARTEREAATSAPDNTGESKAESEGSDSAD